MAELHAVAVKRLAVSVGAVVCLPVGAQQAVPYGSGLPFQLAKQIPAYHQPLYL